MTRRKRGRRSGEDWPLSIQRSIMTTGACYPLRLMTPCTVLNESINLCSVMGSKTMSSSLLFIVEIDGFVHIHHQDSPP